MTRRRISKAPGHTLRCERLEDRRLLAVFTVTSTADAGFGSLRQAIIKANATSAADTIEFAPLLNGATVFLSTGQLEITAPLTIVSDLPNGITIDAQSSSRVFQIDDGNARLIDVTLRGLTISHGYAAGGGGILNRENLAIRHCTLTNNRTPVDDGGAVFSDGGNLTVDESIINNNHAIGSGGGITSLDGDFKLIESLISGNTSRDRGGGVYLRASRGQLTISESTIFYNSAEALGGGLYLREGDLATVDSSVEGNVSSGHGGGIAVYEGSLYLLTTTIADNSADVATSAVGGGVYFRDGELSVVSSTVSQNSSSVGGGIAAFVYGGPFVNLTVTNSTISGNSAASFGGGIAHSHGYLTVTDSILSANETTIFGGGIAAFAYGTPYLSATMTGDTIAGNLGGGIAVAGGSFTVADSDISLNASAGYGGAVLLVEGDLAISSSTLSSNTASYGGGIYVRQGTLSVTETTIDGNSSLYFGGGIATPLDQGPNHITVNRSTISNNLTSALPVTSIGGGIGFSNGSLVVTESTISGNSAYLLGGGIAAFDNADVTVTLSKFTNNDARLAGGGIAFGGGNLTLYDSTLTYNQAISANPLEGKGGALFVGDGNLTMTGSTIANNASRSDGGGIYISNDSILYQTTITNSTISGNVTASRGGGLFNYDGHTSINNSTVTENFAQAGMVGGIASRDDAYTSTVVSSSIISDNDNLDIGFFGTGGNPFQSGGHNLIGFGNATGVFFNYDQTNNVDPRLLPLADLGGPTLTHALLPDSPAINRGNNSLLLDFDQRGAPFARVFDGQADIGAFELIYGDFNDDGFYTCADVDALVAEIAAGTHTLTYDLNSDLLVDQDDLTIWLAVAGAANLPSHDPYLVGDATLDGVVDGMDFIVWNANKFTSIAAWCAGDFTADGTVDGLDFIAWNQNKFQSSATALVTPPIESHNRGLAPSRQPLEPAQSGSVLEQPLVAAMLPAVAQRNWYTVDALFAAHGDGAHSSAAENQHEIAEIMRDAGGLEVF